MQVVPHRRFFHAGQFPAQGASPCRKNYKKVKKGVDKRRTLWYNSSVLGKMLETLFRESHNGGIAQLARAIGSYPIGRGFKSNFRYQRPGGQAAKTPPFHGGNTGSIPVRVTKSINPHSYWECGFFLVLRGFAGVFAVKPQSRVGGYRTAFATQICHESLSWSAQAYASGDQYRIRCYY